jgi:uncharacterized membrane protein
MNLFARRRLLWDYVGGALWVLPTLSVLLFLTAGAMLSRVQVDADSPLWPLAFQGTAEDARGILVVVSATMITVTGLVFAVTIVALQIASGRYSPRLLRNFMRDRGTQVVLSVFVGAFAYSTAGLHTVGIQRSGGEAFVPRLAVSGSLLLGLASVGVLIYFIHHLARSIQAVTIGFERTTVQDVPFGLRRLVDIGNKALSPAVNDPYTGIQAVHHLSVLLCMLAGRRLGDRLHRDEHGMVRAAVPLPQFADYLRLGTAQIRRSGAKEPAVARSLIRLLRTSAPAR